MEAGGGEVVIQANDGFGFLARGVVALRGHSNLADASVCLLNFVAHSLMEFLCSQVGCWYVEGVLLFRRAVSCLTLNKETCLILPFGPVLFFAALPFLLLAVLGRAGVSVPEHNGTSGGSEVSESPTLQWEIQGGHRDFYFYFFA